MYEAFFLRLLKNIFTFVGGRIKSKEQRAKNKDKRIKTKESRAKSQNKREKINSFQVKLIKTKCSEPK